MLKKLLSLIIIIAFISVFSLPAFALPDGNASDTSTTGTGQADDPKTDIKYFVHSKNIKQTDQFLVTIIKPEGNETTFTKSYVVCGFTDLENIRYAVAIFNEETGRYEEIKNDNKNDANDGLWDIGIFGFFTKELTLKEGANKIKIIAFRKSDINALKPGINLQVDYFTVTFLNQSIKDKIINSILKITKIFNDFLNPGK